MVKLLYQKGWRVFNFHLTLQYGKIQMEEVMVRKGQKKRIWTAEQKSEIVHKHLDEHVSVRTLEKEYHADRSMICKWVKRYITEGETSFTNKGHSGNSRCV